MSVRVYVCSCVRDCVRDCVRVCVHAYAIKIALDDMPIWNVFGISSNASFRIIKARNRCASAGCRNASPVKAFNDEFLPRSSARYRFLS